MVTVGKRGDNTPRQRAIQKWKATLEIIKVM